MPQPKNRIPWNKGKRTKYKTFICQNCGKGFEIWEGFKKYRAVKYCSKKCYNESGRVKIDMEKVINLYENEKMPCWAIAELFGVCVDTIRDKIKQRGIKLRPAGYYRIGKGSWCKGKKLPKEVREKMPWKDYSEYEIKVVEMWKLGKSDLDISLELNIPRIQVAKIRNNHDLKNEHKLNRLTYKQEMNLKKHGIACDFSNMNMFRFGTGNLRHELAKLAVCYKLQQLNRTWFTEVPTYNGKIDVYDFTNKIIYELESILTPQKKIEKRKLFVDGMMADMFIFDLRELSENDEIMFHEIVEKVI